MGRLKRLPAVIKSPADKKEYRALKLKNDLTVLLISDLHGISEDDLAEEEHDSPLSDGDEIEEGDEEIEDDEELEEDDGPARKISAAAMSVCVGGFHEPGHVGGLAHFCEHMLFMGSEKYPDENEFTAFCSKHSGSDNAHTDNHVTVYSFDISPNKFEEALDMWSQFFISPLMKKDSVDREMEAVDSEYNNFKAGDDSRKMQIVQECLIKPGHPMGHFMLGNIKSLKTDLPEGITAYDELHKWYPQNYSSRWMNLVIQSPHTLDELERIARDKFVTVPHRDLARPANEPNYNEKGYLENISKLFHYLPLSEKTEIDIVFTLPPQHKKYDTKATHYLGWLIGHEGQGSIMSLLKKKNWAHEIYAGNSGQGHEENGYMSDFSMNLRLTDEGLEHWAEVMAIIFQYIKLLKEIPAEEERRIYDEIQRIEQLNWLSQEEKSSYDNVEEIAESMMMYKTEDWLQGGLLMLNYDRSIIRECLDAMVPSNCYIFLSSKTFAEKFEFSEEKWMGGRYHMQDIGEEQIGAWENIELNGELKLPQSNKYLAEDTKLKTDEPSRQWSKIKKIKENQFGELLYKADSQFDLPRGYIILLIRSEVIRQSVKNDAMFDFFPFLLIRLMAEVAYDAETADLHYSFDSDCHGLKIEVSGLNDKLHLLFNEVINQVKSFNPSQSEFDSLKSQFLDNYTTYMKMAANYGKELRLWLMENTRNDALERKEAFSTVTREEMIDFVKSLRESAWCQMQVEGNFYEKEAIKLFDSAIKTLGVKEPKRDIPIQTVNLQSELIIKTASLHDDDKRSEFIVYWQAGEMKIKDYATLDLLISIMEEPSFDFLRTKKTLGYSVFPTVRCTYGIVGCSLTVRSQVDKFTAEQVFEAIEEFLVEFKQTLKSMKPAEFKEFANSLIALKQQDDNKLRQVVSRNYVEISSEDYKFDRLEVDCWHLERLKKKDVVSFFDKFIEKNKKTLIVAIEGVPEGTEANDKLEPRNLEPGEQFKRFEQITDLRQFKRNNVYYDVASLKE